MMTKSVMNDEEFGKWVKEFLLGEFGDSYPDHKEISYKQLQDLLRELIG